jgi:hypothetical protein
MDHGAGFGGLCSATKWRIELRNSAVQRTLEDIFRPDFKALALT